MTYQWFTHSDEEFWRICGRFFASRAIRATLGMPLSSDDNYRWLVAFDGTIVAGFAAIDTKMTHKSLLRHSFVFPEYRKIGIYKRLLEIRLDRLAELNAKKLEATATAESLPLLIAAGFREVLKKGKYTVVVKDLETK